MAVVPPTPIVPASIVCVANAWFPTSPGGLDRYVYELTYALAALEDNVELCGVGLPESVPNFPVALTNLAEPESSLGQRFRQARTRYLNRHISNPDAINLHFALYSWPLLSQFPSGVPVTFHFHGPWALESEREGANKLGVMVKRWLERRVYARCDRFIVLSKAFGQILHESYEIPWEKINVIPGGVNTERFDLTLERSAARQQLGWPQDRFILFTPRRLVHRMGIDNLLEALALIQRSKTQTASEVWLAIAGKGPLRSHLEARVAALGLTDNVHFLGFLPEEQLPMAYQAANLTVMPSQSLEGFGLVLLESLASGTPAMCTPVGGMPEVLAAFSPELISASAQTAAITETLRGAITGETELPSRDACREYATQNFSWSTIAQQVRDILLTPIE